MPPLPTVPGVARATFFSSLGEDVNIQNRIFVSFTGTMTSAIALTWAEQMASDWQSDLNSLITNQVHLTSVEVLDLSNTLGTAGIADVSYPGVNTNPPVPAQVCMVSHGHVTRRYRGGKPRWYQSGLPTTGLQDEQTWTSTFVNDWSEAFSGFVGDITSFTDGGVSAVTAVNVSYYEGFLATKYPSGRYKNVPQLRATPQVDAIVAYTSDSRLGSQRRRRVLP